MYNKKSEKLGSIKELMLDIESGRVCYAVLSFGGFLSLGEKLFAAPWSVLTVDTENRRFAMDTDEERLQNAPGFDTDNWPNMAVRPGKRASTPITARRVKLFGRLA